MTPRPIFALLLAAGAPGCGILLDFDGLTPPAGRVDAAPASDATLGDAGRDGGRDGSPRADSANDAGADGSSPRDAGHPSDGALESSGCGALASCGGGCVDLVNDPHNCGACGNGCNEAGLSPLCSDASCSLVTLWQGDASTPTSLAVDDAALYWSDEERGSIVSAALDGGTLLTLATQQVTLTALAVDDQNIYWSAGEGTVCVAPKAQHDPSAQRCWNRSFAALGVAPAHGQLIAAVTQTPAAIAEIVSWPTDAAADASPSPLFKADAVATAGPLLQGGLAYWIRTAAADSYELAAVALDGGVERSITVLGGQPNGIALGKGVILVASEDSLEQFFLDGGTPSRSLSSSGAKRVVADEDRVYWSTMGFLLSAPASGTPDGQAPALVFRGALAGIVVTGSYVYFAAPAAGSIMRSKKPQ